MNKIRADRRVGLLLGGVVLATFVAIGATVALPAADPSLRVDATELNEQETKGREIFREHGLWYCEPASVRSSSVDAARYGAGSATAPEDVAGQSPALLGIERIHDEAAAPTAEQLSRDCGVRGLSDEDLAAVDAFLSTRF